MRNLRGSQLTPARFGSKRTLYMKYTCLRSGGQHGGMTPGIFESSRVSISALAIRTAFFSSRCRSWARARAAGSSWFLYMYPRMDAL